MRLYLATGNLHKVEELSRLFAEAGMDAMLLPAMEAGGMPPVEETEESFLGNARLKAKALRERVPPASWVLAEDSGLEVAALGGEPGVRSARYAGPDATDAENRARLLERLTGVPASERKARFVCVMVLLGPSGGKGGSEMIFEGSCPGKIVERERGEGGFGYDPLFVPDGLEETFAEADPALKNRLSHRGEACRKLLDWMRRNPGA